MSDDVLVPAVSSVLTKDILDIWEGGAHKPIHLNQAKRSAILDESYEAASRAIGALDIAGALVEH